MEALISAPLMFAAGVAFYLSLRAIGRMGGSPPPLLKGGPFIATTFVVMVSAGFFYYTARVSALVITNDAILDLLRVGFAFLLWVCFSGGIAIGALIVDRRVG